MISFSDWSGLLKPNIVIVHLPREEVGKVIVRAEKKGFVVHFRPTISSNKLYVEDRHKKRIVSMKRRLKYYVIG